MPELPDVEVLKQYVLATSLHQEIQEVEVHSPQILGDISAQQLRVGLKGRTFESARRHGKYLFVKLDEGNWLVLHFGMTGRLKYFKGLAQDPDYDQLLIRFANGYHLAYEAPRKLGEVTLVNDVETLLEAKRLGPDALDSAFDLNTFKQVLAGRWAMVKSALMNQQIVAGVGNVYSDEILFQAGLHPRTKVNQTG